MTHSNLAIERVHADVMLRQRYWWALLLGVASLACADARADKLTDKAIDNKATELSDEFLEYLGDVEQASENWTAFKDDEPTDDAPVVKAASSTATSSASSSAMSKVAK